MAVYTHIAAEDMAEYVRAFDAGELRSAKGIAEGVENSNYLVETDKGRFIFTSMPARATGCSTRGSPAGALKAIRAMSL